MSASDISTIVNAFLAAMTVIVPIVIGFLGKAAYQLISAHTTGQQQLVLQQLALAAVSAAEQAMKGKPGAVRFAEADAFLAASLPKRAKLTPEQRRAFIETAVRSLNAGVIALAPNTAALLTPEAASAAPGVDVQTITDSAAQAASSAIRAQVPSAVQSALQTLLAPLAPLISILGAFGTATSNVATPASVDNTPIVDTAASPATQASTQTVRVQRPKAAPATVTPSAPSSLTVTPPADNVVLVNDVTPVGTASTQS